MKCSSRKAIYFNHSFTATILIYRIPSSQFDTYYIPVETKEIICVAIVTELPTLQHLQVKMLTILTQNKALTLFHQTSDHLRVHIKASHTESFIFPVKQ